MKQEELKNISSQRYNNWCERRPLVCADSKLYSRASLFFVKKHLSSSERAAFFLHELTGCNGFEFVSFSNAKVKEPIKLPFGVIIYPCFLNDIQGKDFKDTLVQFTLKMQQKSRYIYDCWIPIPDWDEIKVRRKIRSIDEALSIFSLRGRTFFEWKPKYPAPNSSTSTYNFEVEHFNELENISNIIDTLSDCDRIAIFRSLAWLSQGIRLNDPSARFLFSILSLESLATYIEEQAPDDSPFMICRTQKVKEIDKIEKRNKCIKETLEKYLDNDPKRAIEKSYFNCVITITQKLKLHINKIFDTDSEPYELLFKQKVEGKILYDLRHYIAHGTSDTLSEIQRERISKRIWDAERIARRYIMTVLEKSLGIKFLDGTKRAASFIGVNNMVISRDKMYTGPTHMAILYGA